MFIAGLQTKGVFCSHCLIDDGCISVGLITLRDPSLIGRVVELIQSENQSGDRYRVRIPAIKYNPDYQIILERIT